MARKGVKTSTTPVKAVEGATAKKNTVKPVEGLSAAYSGQRIASTNIPVYGEAGGDMVGVIAGGRRVALTGKYADLDGVRYVEIRGLGFVKDYSYLL